MVVDALSPSRLRARRGHGVHEPPDLAAREATRRSARADARSASCPARPRIREIPHEVKDAATVVTSTTAIPPEAAWSSWQPPAGSARSANTAANSSTLGRRQRQHPLRRALRRRSMADWRSTCSPAFENYAPIVVGVGDVGQLPPIEAQRQPLARRPRLQPLPRLAYARTRPAQSTFAIDLPAVWRPHGNQLGIWRAFYRDWERLDCVAAPEDRTIDLPPMNGAAADIWRSGRERASDTARGRWARGPRGARHRPAAPAGDRGHDGAAPRGRVQRPRSAIYDDTGAPVGTSRDPLVTARHGDPLIVILASRNAAVDDAHQLVERLTEMNGLRGGGSSQRPPSTSGRDRPTGSPSLFIHSLAPTSSTTSTPPSADSPSTCTRATHGLLLVTRAGIDLLLSEAPARPGTPLGEPRGEDASPTNPSTDPGLVRARGARHEAASPPGGRFLSRHPSGARNRLCCHCE